jgi:hypothetical protein
MQIATFRPTGTKKVLNLTICRRLYDTNSKGQHLETRCKRTSQHMLLEFRRRYYASDFAP